LPYYLTYDQVGSLKLVADASGNVIKGIDYDSFGSIINDTNLGFTIPFGFAGGLYDQDTGLVRFGFRDYDPDTGRWTAKDPIGFSGGDVNLFGYCLNNPLNYTDPRGKGFWKNVGEFIKNFFMGVGDAISPIPPSAADPEAAQGYVDLRKSIQQRYEEIGEETGEWGPNNDYYFNLGVKTKDGKSYLERLEIRKQVCPTE
jgi:RHS repeat-associated protein